MTIENYVTIGADIDNDFNTFYFLKVGMTTRNVIKRCNTQRLKLIWTVTPPNEECYEGRMQNAARKLFGATDFDYRPAGCDESFGRFETALEAYEATWALLEYFHALEIFKIDNEDQWDLRGMSDEDAKRVMIEGTRLDANSRSATALRDMALEAAA
tara:strand:+ start:266 stop:736 length:471 start_codon:yes stop_codon:yes gene_type:complete